MFAILKKLVGGRSAKGRKAAAGFRPALEALEGRDLMSVAGYSAVGMKDFFIDSTNTLRERDQYGSVRTLTTSASQVSVLQSDAIPYSSGSGGLVVNGFTPYASARADVLMQNGDLKQWDDATASFKPIATGVKQVSAGWGGNSAVLLTNGNLWLCNADTPSATLVASGIASTSLGTDLNGQPMIDMVTTAGTGYEWRAAGGLEYLGTGVKQISAGVGGQSAVLYPNGRLYSSTDSPYTSTGAYTGLATCWYVAYATSVSCGTDAAGGVMIDFVGLTGTAYEFDSTSGIYKGLGSGVVEADAGCSGVTDLCYSNGTFARFNDNYGSGYADTLTVLLAMNRNSLG